MTFLQAFFFKILIIDFKGVDSNAKTQGTNCSGLETIRVLLVLECLWRRSG